DQHRLDLSAAGGARRCACVGRSGARHRRERLLLDASCKRAAALAPNRGPPRIERQAQEFSTMNQMIRKTQQETNKSPNKTSHSGAGPDELVPSRYALKVGEIDVLVVSDGVLTLPGAMLAHNAEPAVRAAWLKDNFLPPDAFDWALNAVVVKSGGRTILVDAGMGEEFPLPRAGQLPHRLEAAGIDLSSVTDVVLTHMH